jgi:DNA-binding protein HU-beta
MNKTDLVAFVAESADLPKKDAQAATEAFLDGITEALADGDKVSLPGFGTFDVRHRQARKGINPSTKETIDIAACKSVGFKAGKQLKDKVQ